MATVRPDASADLAAYSAYFENRICPADVFEAPVDVMRALHVDAQPADRHADARAWFEEQFGLLVSRGESPTHAAAEVLKLARQRSFPREE
mmetsp:Transcript_35172/g.76988  ORF Transcript_35172/g.76988 Transcript_35172/m.76988 type:complete len:91 (+) Transcript_35172:64-336(+)|eukprot:CAMPEP_0204317522 /NCGR_PEP_ID=MMETSP0469-20131031/6021_1 /ASSEMBLY_ACC=CAM_ASM_000384 /TAXON_ID=2969 /ORGANISM="Oxyrrhis marina" /LENGTH=90 /DNA_ID=CAMNT_0051298459 /DNA_START=62 /DNA_END=334 /DNA_ORIENTATION=+